MILDADSEPSRRRVLTCIASESLRMNGERRRALLMALVLDLHARLEWELKRAAKQPAAGEDKQTAAAELAAAAAAPLPALPTTCNDRAASPLPAGVPSAAEELEASAQLGAS